MCGIYMKYCSDFIAFIVDLYTLGYFRLNVCVRGVFLSRIYVANSDLISAPTYFGK